MDAIQVVMATEILDGSAALQALTLFFAAGVGVSLLAMLHGALYESHRSAPENYAFGTSYIAWLFALLSTTCLVAFICTAAHADILTLLRSGEVVLSRSFILFVLGALHLLPIATLVLEDVGKPPQALSLTETSCESSLVGFKVGREV